MVTIIFRMKVKDGKEEETLERMTKMAEAVEAQEPGALAYLFHRSQQDPSELVLFESYQDDAAFQSHMQTAHMGELQASLSDLVDTTQMKVERLDRVAGFARASAG
jgi:quinol monooxygenase YgiN